MAAKSWGAEGRDGESRWAAELSGVDEIVGEEEDSDTRN